MKKKFYAVRNGRETGIFEDWATCEKQIRGYSGAEYKSFKTEQEALDYLGKRSVSDDQVEQQYPCAYIDGSYDRLSHRFSYGAVIMTAPGCEEHFSKAFEDPALVDMRNVAGEIKGSEFAISYALEQGWPKISIYYDYSGIEKWATGEWKRNLPATQAYFVFCQNAFQQVNVQFIKVKGHSGNTYNDMADALARKALNLVSIGV